MMDKILQQTPHYRFHLHRLCIESGCRPRGNAINVSAIRHRLKLERTTGSISQAEDYREEASISFRYLSVTASCPFDLLFDCCFTVLCYCIHRHSWICDNSRACYLATRIDHSCSFIFLCCKANYTSSALIC